MALFLRVIDSSVRKLLNGSNGWNGCRLHNDFTIVFDSRTKTFIVFPLVVIRSDIGSFNYLCFL